MNERWDDFAEAVESGESDRVNAAIDDVEDMGLDERAQLFESRFDDLTELYADSDDGYVRQSTVRFLEALSPGLVAAFAVDDGERSTDLDRETVRRQADASSGFLLEAMTDTDGRVRNAAKRALKDVFRTYDTLDDEETITALAAELESMAEEYTGKRREHLLDAREDAEFAKRSGLGDSSKDSKRSSETSSISVSEEPAKLSFTGSNHNPFIPGARKIGMDGRIARISVIK